MANNSLNFCLQRMTTSWNICKSLREVTFLTHAAHFMLLFPCFSPLGKRPTGSYILLVLIFFLNLSKGSTVPIFMIFFHWMEDICVNFIDPDLFFRFLDGRCHGNRFWAKLAKWHLLNTLAFRKTIPISQFRFTNILNGNMLHSVQILSRSVH